MNSLDTSTYLLNMSLDSQYKNHDQYPFSLPAVRALDTLNFHPKVTFLIGENGSGKSTLIEALAMAVGFNAEGGSRNFNFSTSATHSQLYQLLKVARGVVRPRDGFFLRAESFYNVASAVDDNNKEAGGLLDAYGGKSLHQQSHGESFMSLVRHRFRGQGLYIMDEPEAALSVSRQMEFLALMHKLVQNKSQLVIATHSPILLSYPDATIYQISDDEIKTVNYEETEQYQLTKYFLSNYQTMLKEILQ